MKIEALQTQGLILITLDVYRDGRGFFMEVMRKKNLSELGIDHDLVQVNQSHSVQNVIRGLHYQTEPQAQGKLVRVVTGKIIDVAVDIRRDSPTFLHWEAVILDAEKPQLFWLPRGFAHGFGVLSSSATVEYMCDNYYSAGHDAGIVYNDPDLGIDWSITNPILSDKDTNLPTVRQLDFKS